MTSKKVQGLRASAAIAGLVLGVSALATQPKTTVNELQPGAARPAIKIEPARIRAHVEVLASDPAEGRGSGGRGGTLAAEYIAKQFASYGLHPAGDNGSYFQDVPMTEVTTLGETSFTLVGTNLETMTLRNLEDFVTNNETGTESIYIDAPVVFVGYGIRAPEYDWDDYKDADLSGKVALLLAGAPASQDPRFFNGKAATDYGGWRYKFAEAARHGALAALIIHRDLAGDNWQAVRNSWGTRRAYLRQDLTPRLRAASWLRSEAAGKLATLAGVDLEKLLGQAQPKEFRPMELPLRLQAHVASQARAFVARNVLAVRPTGGSESNEAVLYTARYDRSGLASAVTEPHIDSVDDATGCGVLLEVARAWAHTPSPPARMILFAALTAEDQGLLGSQYLAKHSPVAPGRISLALNYGTLAPLGDTDEVVVSGAERTTVYSTVQARAKALGLAIRPDPHPERGGYYRSSPFSLARAGIPAFSIAQGSKFKGHDRPQTTDVSLRETDFTGAARLGTLGYGLGVAVSSQPELIGWLPGDEFAVERKRSQLADQLKRKPPLRSTKRVK